MEAGARTLLTGVTGIDVFLVRGVSCCVSLGALIPTSVVRFTGLLFHPLLLLLPPPAFRGVAKTEEEDDEEDEDEKEGNIMLIVLEATEDDDVKGDCVSASLLAALRPTSASPDFPDK